MDDQIADPSLDKETADAPVLQFECQDQQGEYFDKDGLRQLVVQQKIHAQSKVRAVGESKWRTAEQIVDSLVVPTPEGTRRASKESEGTFFMDKRPWLGLVLAIAMFAFFAIMAWLKNP